MMINCQHSIFVYRPTIHCDKFKPFKNVQILNNQQCDSLRIYMSTKQMDMICNTSLFFFKPKIKTVAILLKRIIFSVNIYVLIFR